MNIQEKSKNYKIDGEGFKNQGRLYMEEDSALLEELVNL